MKNTRDLHRARCRVRWAAAIALGAVVVLAPSQTWSQNRGGIVPSETPRPLVLSGGSTVQEKIDGPSISVFTSPFATSGGSVVSLRVVVLQKNGKDEGELVSYAGLGSRTLGTSILRRFVMVALP